MLNLSTVLHYQAVPKMNLFCSLACRKWITTGQCQIQKVAAKNNAFRGRLLTRFSLLLCVYVFQMKHLLWNTLLTKRRHWNQLTTMRLVKPRTHSNAASFFGWRHLGGWRISFAKPMILHPCFFLFIFYCSTLHVIRLLFWIQVDLHLAHRSAAF